MKAPKFKVGQKVRVIKWLDMPQYIQDSYNINIWRLKEIGTVTRLLEKDMGVNAYDIIFDDNKYPYLFFEPELEPLVRIGEQLLLFEL